MQAFRCLAQECEDTCCKLWSVSLDEVHYGLIQQLGTQHPTLQSIINSSVFINQNAEAKHQFANIEMDSEGYCPFLNQESLCQLHHLGGINVLGNTCANYPRVYYQIDDSLQIMGAFSCPEVTRLCFRSKQPATLFPVTSEILPRQDYSLTHHIDTQHASYYEHCFPFIRDVFLNIAIDRAYSSKQRLYLLCYLSQRICEYYNNDCDDSIEPMLQDELQRFSSTTIQQKLLLDLENFKDLDNTGLNTVHSIFTIRIQHYYQDPLTPYINDIIESYLDDMPFEQQAEAFTMTYFQRKKIITTEVHAQLEDYLSRHLQNCLLREWFVRFPDPFTYMQMLTLRQAMLRFLLYSHPSIQQWCQTGPEHMDETLHTVIEEISVEIFYLFSRSIEHDVDFLKNVYSALLSENMMNLDASLAFIKGL